MTEKEWERHATLTDGRQAIFFYGTGSVFSNFHPAPFEAESYFGKKLEKYSCSEQYFMHAKAECFGDASNAKLILEATKPGQMKAAGRRVLGYDDQKWDEVRDDVMYAALRAKFGSNPDLLKHLLETDNAVIVEATPMDRIWGIGLGMTSNAALDPNQWRGKNRLGVLLHRVRDEFAAEQANGAQ